MASIRKEILIEASPATVWAAVRDFGAVHRRLFPGLLTDARLDAEARVVTFANGKTVRELLVDIDDATRRLVWAAVGASAKHHNASMQVIAEGERLSRLVWITDFLPSEITGTIASLIDQGTVIVKEALEKGCRDTAR
jgi:carbon monoxide dehydrogenase subunit G